jgi:hypothetical protein
MSESESKQEKSKKKILIKEAKEEKKKVKKVKKQLRKVSKEKEEVIEMRKKRYIIETIIISIFIVFMLILLCNRTFFREEYKTSKIDIDLPLLTFFVKDSDGVIELKTLRKSEYLKEYFDSYLSKLSRYNCNDVSFYYDEVTRTAIYDISVNKVFALKTIKIKYQNGNPNCLCNGQDEC